MYLVGESCAKFLYGESDTRTPCFKRIAMSAFRNATVVLGSKDVGVMFDKACRLLDSFCLIIALPICARSEILTYKCWVLTEYQIEHGPRNFCCIKVTELGPKESLGSKSRALSRFPLGGK